MNAHEAAAEAHRRWGSHAFAMEETRYENFGRIQHSFPIYTVGLIGRGTSFEVAFELAEKNGLRAKDEQERLERIALAHLGTIRAAFHSGDRARDEHEGDEIAMTALHHTIENSHLAVAVGKVLELVAKFAAIDGTTAEWWQTFRDLKAAQQELETLKNTP